MINKIKNFLPQAAKDSFTGLLFWVYVYLFSLLGIAVIVSSYWLGVNDLIGGLIAIVSFAIIVLPLIIFLDHMDR